MIRAFCILLGFDLAGEILRSAAHLPIPGPVIGMLGLAIVLIVRSQRPVTAPASGEMGDGAPPGLEFELDRVAHGLISNMGLLFVPAGVGVITEAALFKAQWLPLVVGALGSTLIGLVVTALVMQRSLPKNQAEADAPPTGGGP